MFIFLKAVYRAKNGTSDEQIKEIIPSIADDKNKVSGNAKERKGLVDRYNKNLTGALKNTYAAENVGVYEQTARMGGRVKFIIFDRKERRMDGISHQ